MDSHTHTERTVKNIMHSGTGGWTKPFHRRVTPPPTDKTLFAEIADTIVKGFPRNRVHVNTNDNTIKIQSISFPSVVHKITVERVL